MKVLLRKYDNKYYVWKDATWKDGGYYVGDEQITQTNILSIKEDNREKYVLCCNCGAIIKDDPVSIEKHFADEEAKKNCFECRSLRVDNFHNVNITYVKNEDGTYHQTKNADVVLRCTQYWPSRDINNPDINSGCLYHRCRKLGTRPISDVFMKYPGLFDKQITVDLLQSKGFEYECCRNGYFEYDLKLRGTLKACVNELGIVDHFIIRYRYSSAHVYYSEKYNELFYVCSGDYCSRDDTDVSESKHNAVKAKISALYKEASK